MPREPNLTYDAPLLSVDLPAYNDEDEQPYEVWPCQQCLPWHVEVVEHEFYPRNIAVREWHAADCPELNEAFGEIRDHTHDDHEEDGG